MDSVFIDISIDASRDLSRTRPACLFGQLVNLKPPGRTGTNFYDDFSILTFGG